MTPIGTVLIGTKGRVDFSGRAGTVRFILADKSSSGPKFETRIFMSEEEKNKFEEQEKNNPKPEINWVWKISSDPPKITYTALNQDTFLQCLMQVING